MSFVRPLLLLLLAGPMILAAWEWRRMGHRLVLPFDHGDLPTGRGLERLVKSLQTSGPVLLGPGDRAPGRGRSR